MVKRGLNIVTVIVMLCVLVVTAYAGVAPTTAVAPTMAVAPEPTPTPVVALTAAPEPTSTGTASGGIVVEQFQAMMPEMQVWFYISGDKTPEEVTLMLEGKGIESSFVGRNESMVLTQHYFLVDVSGTISQAQMEAVKAAISEFAANMGPSDKLTLISFGEELNMLVESSNDVATIETALAGLVANEQYTLLYDALAMAANSTNEEMAMDRKLVYIFSDMADDNMGGYTAAESEALLKDAGMSMYGFGFDNGVKENLDNFGAMARSTGGDIEIVSVFDLGTSFTQTVTRAQDEVWLAHFTAETNRLPSDGTQLRLEASGQSSSFVGSFNYSIEDDIAPTIVSAVQEGDTGIKLVFSEAVSGANVRDNYTVQMADGTLVGVSAAAYNESDFSVLLSLEGTLVSGDFEVGTIGIVDVSAEENAVQGTVSVSFTAAEVVVEEPVEQGGVPPIAWVVVAVLLVSLIAIIAVSSSRRKAAKEQEWGGNVYVKEELNGGETGRAHFVQGGVQKTVSLEISGASGNAKRVTLPIKSTMFVGRSEICDVVFEDLRMSRQHFVIEDTGEGFALTNLSETGGTMLNGVPVKAKRPLHSGDRIEAGAQSIVFIVEGG